jgi:hypothetical protein
MVVGGVAPAIPVQSTHLQVPAVLLSARFVQLIAVAPPLSVIDQVSSLLLSPAA